MRKASSQRLAIVPLALLLGACTNGGKNLRDSTGMTPGSAAGQLGDTSAIPAATADSTTSRRDTLGGRMSRMMPGASRDSMRHMMRDTADCPTRDRGCRRP